MYIEFFYFIADVSSNKIDWNKYTLIKSSKKINNNDVFILVKKNIYNNKYGFETVLY
jgi:hypothetical protein